MDQFKNLRLFWDYTWSLLSQVEYLYGLVTLGFAVLTGLGFLDVSVALPTWAWTILLFLSLYFGSFSVYREVCERLPEVADLSITDKETRIVSGWGGRGPSNPRVEVRLQLSNSGAERAKLTEIRFGTIELNTESLEARIAEARFYVAPSSMPGPGKQRLSVPYSISGRDWVSIRCDLPFTVVDSTLEDIARTLKRLSVYNTEIIYQYEDMDGNSHSDLVPILGSYDNFRKRAIEQWKRTGRDDLVVKILEP